MEWKEFKYFPYLPHKLEPRQEFKFEYKPVIEVRVSGLTGSDSIPALVDSGTDITMLDEEIGRNLGVVLTKGIKPPIAKGIGGEKEGSWGQVRIEVPGFEEVLTVNAIFIPDIEGQIILGRNDFFVRFLVRFEQHRKKLYLKPAPTPDEPRG